MVIFLILDAFRSDYINKVDTPFLYGQIKKGLYCPKMKSSSGFTQRSSIFTGTYPRESDNFTMYTFDFQNSPYAFLKSKNIREYHSKSIFEKLPTTAGWGLIKDPFMRIHRRKNINNRLHIQKLANENAHHAPISFIPYSLLPYIGISEDVKPIYEPKSLKNESIFDIFSEKKINFKYLMYPATDLNDDLVHVKTCIASKMDYDIILSQLSECDEKIHYHGPSSLERRKIIGEIDRKVRSIHNQAPKDTTWIIIGDHGMTDVKKIIDIQKIILFEANELNMKFCEDYFYFLDSTMARILVLKNKSELEKKLKENKKLKSNGIFVDDSIAKKYDIPSPSDRYGNIIWWANSGTLIFPDFFHETQMKGMHGYRPDEKDSEGFLLSFGKNIKNKILENTELIDVCNLITGVLNLRSPIDSKGKSIIDEM